MRPAFGGMDSEGSAGIFQKLSLQNMLQEAVQDLELQLMHRLDASTAMLRQLVSEEERQRSQGLTELRAELGASVRFEDSFKAQLQELWSELQHSCRQQLRLLEQSDKNSEDIGNLCVTVQAVKEQLRGMVSRDHALVKRLEELEQRVPECSSTADLSLRLDQLIQDVGVLGDRICGATLAEPMQERLIRLEQDVAALGDRTSNTTVEFLAHRLEVSKSLTESAKDRVETEASLAALRSALSAWDATVANSRDPTVANLGDNRADDERSSLQDSQHLKHVEPPISVHAERAFIDTQAHHGSPQSALDEGLARSAAVGTLTPFSRESPGNPADLLKQDIQEVQALVAQHRQVLSNTSQLHQSLMDSLAPGKSWSSASKCSSGPSLLDETGPLGSCASAFAFPVQPSSPTGASSLSDVEAAIAAAFPSQSSASPGASKLSDVEAVLAAAFPPQPSDPPGASSLGDVEVALPGSIQASSRGLVSGSSARLSSPGSPRNSPSLQGTVGDTPSSMDKQVGDHAAREFQDFGLCQATDETGSLVHA